MKNKKITFYLLQREIVFFFSEFVSLNLNLKSEFSNHVTFLSYTQLNDKYTMLFLLSYFLVYHLIETKLDDSNPINDIFRFKVYS